MFQRFHALREQREGGFTLIELLVVILIIAILAAIAIPVFLNQRKKGWVDQAKSAARNAATAEETWLTEEGKTEYTNSVEELESVGFNRTSSVQLTITHSGADSYCITANHDSLPAAENYFYSSENGEPRQGSCPAAAP